VHSLSDLLQCTTNFSLSIRCHRDSPDSARRGDKLKFVVHPYGRTHNTGHGALRIMNSAVSVRFGSPLEPSEVVIATRSALCRPAYSTTSSPTPPCSLRNSPSESVAFTSAKNLSRVAWPPSAGSSSPSLKTQRVSNFAFVLRAIETAMGRICFESPAKSVTNRTVLNRSIGRVVRRGP